MCCSFSGYTQEEDTLYVNSDDLEDPISYGAKDSLYMDLKNNVVHLYGEAYVDNGMVNMTAGYIMIDIGKSEVLATYRYDTDSNEVEKPVFTDGSDQIDARTIRYNFKTEKAFIEEVAIKQDENFLYMGTAKRHSNEEIHFLKGRFTTCNLEEPHYHFQLSRAVLVPEKRIVSGPMNLWVKGVPTPLGLPFSVIPQMEERTSGLLFPEIIPLSAYGFGFQDLGYYIPINDRLQTTVYGTLYSRGSWGIRNQTDYAKIYKFRGLMNVGFQQFKSGFPDNTNKNKLTVQWTHKMEAKANPYWNFSSNVNFISDNNSQNNLDPINPQYFNNTFNSDINIRRSFPGKPISAGAKLSMRQNSLTHNISLSSPVVNVNTTRFFPLERFVNGSKGIKGLITRLGVTYGFEGQNRAVFADTLIRDKQYTQIGDQFQNGISQQMVIQTTGSLFKNALKLTPSLTYRNKINFQQIEKTYDSAADSLIIDTLQQIGTANDLNFNVKLTTVLYSYYQFIGKKKAKLRHVLTPSIGYSYIPNLNPLKSYFSTADSMYHEYSPFERSVYTAGNTKDQSLITFGVNNTFELKRRSDKDTITGFKKTRLIELLSASGNYDMLKDSMNLSPISLNLRIRPIKWLNIVTAGTFSPYDWIDSTGVTIKYYALSNGRLGRLTRANVATTLTFTSKEGRNKLNNVIDQIDQNWNADYEYFLLHPEYAINFDIPWKLSFSHVYTLNANTSISSTNPDRYTSIQTLAINGDVSFTKRWKLSTITNLDIKNLNITNSRFSLTRDMHCWALAFHWTPIGNNKSFLFSLRATSDLFQDAKIELRKPPVFL